MLKKVIPFLLIIGAFEGISWWIYSISTSKSPIVNTPQTSLSTENPPVFVSKQDNTEEISGSQEQAVKKDVPIEGAPRGVISEQDWTTGSFPPPSTAVVNGVTERTIHMGVRQWAWDPNVIRAKEGELVRLVIHNADVKHAIVIPDLNVQQDIPPDGAVVEFRVNKRGTFDFLCSTYCGVGHAEMQGKLTVE